MISSTVEDGIDTRVSWFAVVSFWVFISLVFIVRAQLYGGTVPLLSDTDDALRLVQVRDLLNGQGWFDLTQHRLNPPLGTEIHWSRLVDAPIAGLILLLRPFFGAAADIWAAWAWPLILLLVLLAGSAHLCIRLLGKEALLPSVVLPVISAALMFQFAPGRIDHHNVQILLTLFIVSGTLFSWRHPAWAIVAGCCAAVSLAIGTETLPFVVMAIATFGAIFVLAPQHAAAPRNFGLSLGLATLAVLVGTIASDRWLAPLCDQISIVYVVAALAAGTALVLPTLITDRLPGFVSRLVAVGLAGIASVALVVWLFPQCLGGPYAQLDPWLAENWLARITEARPIWGSLAGLPAYTIGITVPPILALIAVGIKIWIDPKDRPQWLILFAFLAFAVLVMIVQIRGARLAAVLAVPGGAWVIVSARLRYLAARTVLNTAALVMAWLIFSGLLLAVAVNFAFPDPNPVIGTNVDVAGGTTTKYDCYMPQSFDALRALPTQLLMAPSDLGAHILEETTHSVVGAPYHRNERGLLDTIRFFNGSEVEARQLAEVRGIETVVICDGLPELTGFADPAPDSIVATLKGGKMPDWLAEQGDPDEPIRIFKILPPSPALAG